MENRCCLVSVVVLFAFLAAPCLGTDWPQWRGPFFNGSTDETDLPASWSETENLRWVKPLPGPSGATAIVAGGRIFFFSGHIAFHQREEPLLNTLTVLNAYNGLRLWSRTLGGIALTGKHCVVTLSDGAVVCLAKE